MKINTVPSEHLVQEKFKECLEIFTAESFDKNGTANSCKIFDVFCQDNRNHNCLGCNFADSSMTIKRYLERFRMLDNIKDDFPLYIILLYLLVERIEVVFDILQIPTVYKEKYFKVFQQVRKWANFIKHPKSFILTHHPVFDFENSGTGNDRNKFEEVINDSFVNTYYKGNADAGERNNMNKELLKKLKNKRDILVLYPDIAALTKKMCFSYNKFIELITKNEVYIDILNDEATINDYFEKD